MKSFLFLVVVASASLALVACGEVKTSKARKVDAIASEHQSIRRFLPANLTFSDTQLFLWKEGFTKHDVANVLEKVQNYDVVKGDLYRALLERKSLLERFTAIEVDVVALPEQEVALQEKQAELDKAKKELEEALKISPQTEETETQAKRLKRTVDRLEAKIKPVKDTLEKIKTAGLEGAYQVWKSLEQSVTFYEGLAQESLDSIDRTVWIYNSSPIRFNFRFNSDRGLPISVGIENWDLEKIHDGSVQEPGAPKEFSTESQTIRNVTYATLGGVFTFEVLTPGAVFYFKVARTKYAAKDGRIYLKGDLVRCSVLNGAGRPVILHERDEVECGVDTTGLDLLPSEVGKPVMRSGAANLVDKDLKDLRG